MNNKTEGIINLIAALLVLFSAMLEPQITIYVSLVLLIGLAAFHFLKK